MLKKSLLAVGLLAALFSTGCSYWSTAHLVAIHVSDLTQFAAALVTLGVNLGGLGT